MPTECRGRRGQRYYFFKKCVVFYNTVVLTALLRRLDYTYPYHQSIGFYLKRAGYPESDQLLAKREPIEFDFYLSHNLKAPDFDPEWRVFFPRSSK